MTEEKMPEEAMGTNSIEWPHLGDALEPPFCHSFPGGKTAFFGRSSNKLNSLLNFPFFDSRGVRTFGERGGGLVWSSNDVGWVPTFTSDCELSMMALLARKSDNPRLVWSVIEEFPRRLAKV